MPRRHAARRPAANATATTAHQPTTRRPDGSRGRRPDGSRGRTDVVPMRALQPEECDNAPDLARLEPRPAGTGPGVGVGPPGPSRPPAPFTRERLHVNPAATLGTRGQL